MKTCYVYHIHKLGDTLEDGYIGISVNPESRIKDHFSRLNKGIHSNKTLQESFNSLYTYRIILKGSVDYCKFIKTKLKYGS